jgi:hypothetical protein
MRRRMGFLVAVAVIVAVVVVVVVRSGGGGQASRQRTISMIAGNVARGASAALVKAQQAVAGAIGLHVVLPDTLIHAPRGGGPPQTDPKSAAFYAAAGWRGALIAAAAAARIPTLTEFATTDRAGAQAPGSSFFLDGSVRTAPGENPATGMSKLGSVAPSAARKQLDDNLRVLSAGLPAGSITRATVTEIRVDPSRRDTAFAVELRVKSLVDLRRRLGDLLGGLGTGLAPGLSSTVEGLAIHVVDAAGRNAGSWMVTRAQLGTTVMDPRIHPPAVMVPRLPFVNETGGPSALPSAHAGPLR